eukprot:TRINITY_DN5579_c0_g1_i2.p1 TRINITY_DN5579_c0_g1~~TRINITY_DN5579_c0_g1_i2.p1  ORF type:complete len:340 (-),score=68.73 TRINITY_DN5579_c0_g1_i2:149-1168(-)
MAAMWHWSSGKDNYKYYVGGIEKDAETFLIIGSNEPVSAWILRRLHDENKVTEWRNRMVTIENHWRENDALEILTIKERMWLAQEMQRGDLSNLQFMQKVFNKFVPTTVVYLGGSSVIECKENLIEGAKSNIMIMLNIFECARILKEKNGVSPVILYELPFYKDLTHYHVFKQVNEGNARVYWHDHQIPSVGFRFPPVYGVGCETEEKTDFRTDFTQSIQSAVFEGDFTFTFGGKHHLSYADDVAKIFLEFARLRTLSGAFTVSIDGDEISIEDWVKLVEEAVPSSKGRIKLEEEKLPKQDLEREEGDKLESFLPEIQKTPFVEGIKKTVEIYSKKKKK